MATEFDKTWLKVAETVARDRGHCSRLQVGCVIVNGETRSPISVGYNGNYKGGPNECDVIKVPGGCGCIHAETNALLKSDNTLPKRIMYITHAPCKMCAKIIINSGISKVVYSEAYRATDGVHLLRQAGTPVLWIPRGDLYPESFEDNDLPEWEDDDDGPCDDPDCEFCG